jgi:PTS system nitrogen regulatory IIA component
MGSAKASLLMTKEDLVSYFHSDLFIPELEADCKDDAIKLMVSHLARRKTFRNEKIVLETLRMREKLGSTGIGKGIAIPHGRSSVTKELTLLFARSSAGVDFDAVDGKPAHLFFMILAPHVDKENLYLPLLGKVVEATKDATVRRRLMKAAGIEAVTEVLTKGMR